MKRWSRGNSEVETRKNFLHWWEKYRERRRRRRRRKKFLCPRDSRAKCIGEKGKVTVSIWTMFRTIFLLLLLASATRTHRQLILQWYAFSFMLSFFLFPLSLSLCPVPFLLHPFDRSNNVAYTAQKVKREAKSWVLIDTPLYAREERDERDESPVIDVASGGRKKSTNRRNGCLLVQVS